MIGATYENLANVAVFIGIAAFLLLLLWVSALQDYLRERRSRQNWESRWNDVSRQLEITCQWLAQNPTNDSISADAFRMMAQTEVDSKHVTDQMTVTWKIVDQEAA